MNTASPLPSPSHRRAGDREVSKPKKTLDRGLLFTTLCIGSYLAFLLLGGAREAINRTVSDVVSIVLPFLGFAWSLKGVRGARTSGTLSANLLSISLFLYGCGSSLYTYYDVVLRQQPFPSWADAGYLLNNVAALAAIIVLPHRPVPGVLRIRVLLDSLMVMAALVTFSWFFALGPTVLAADQPLIGKVLGAGYPIMDLATMFCAVVLAGMSPEPALRRVRNLICASVLAYVIADSGYLIESLHGTYKTGQPLDAGWFLANLLFAQAAVSLREIKVSAGVIPSTKQGEAEARLHVPSLWRLLAPYALVPAVVVLNVYVYEKVKGGLAAGVYVGSALLLVLILARQVFAIAENTRLYRFLQNAYRDLEALATVDGMTGLWNHRTFHERFHEELRAAKENGTPVALLLMDVDRFKSYNDSFGHPAGDEALRMVGQLLKSNMRRDDLPARYGGEEFAAILPATEAEEAVRIAERIRAACAAETFPCRSVTLSIGVVVGDQWDADVMIERADQALYAAKRNGRDQVVLDSLGPRIPNPLEIARIA